MKKLLLTSVGMLLSLATAAHADLTQEQVRRILHVLNNAKPNAFAEAQKCASTAVDYATIHFCVVHSLQLFENLPQNWSARRMLSESIGEAQARAAMIKCLVDKKTELSREAWNDCLDNSPAVPFR